MLGFIDIHSHILPGVDDGARNMDETLTMLSIAYAEGTVVMIATPHYFPGRKNVKADKLKRLAYDVNMAAAEQGLKIQVILGNELLYSMDLIRELSSGVALTINETRYILVEFLSSASFREITFGLNQCICAGYIPILAHTERYQCLKKRDEVVDQFINMGAYIQLNASSISKSISNHEFGFCHRLLKRNAVHFIATDAHSVYKRSPRLLNMVNFLVKKYGVNMVERLLWNNPTKMIENEQIDLL